VQQLFSPPGFEEGEGGLCFTRVYKYFSDFCQTSYLYRPVGPIGTKSAGLVKLWPSMNDLKIFFLSLNERCRGNQFLFIQSTACFFVKLYLRNGMTLI